MTIITARTRALALSVLIPLSLTACFEGDNKHNGGSTVASLRGADQSADQCAEPGADDFRHA